MDASWMPIETAPKDGTAVIVGRFEKDPRVAVCEYVMHTDYPGEVAPVGCWAFTDQNMVVGFWEMNRPTHWMCQPTHWMRIPEGQP